MSEVHWQQCGACGAPMFKVTRGRTRDSADIECANTECEHGLMLWTSDIQLDEGDVMVFALGGRWGVRVNS